MKVRRLASSHGVGPSLWKSQMAALGRGCVKTENGRLAGWFSHNSINSNHLLSSNNYLIFEGISVDEQGKQHYLDVQMAYRQACLNAIEYLSKFGYSRAQAYTILGTAPVQGHISGVVDIPNACATLWLPTEIFDFDIMPSASGPTKHIKGDIQIPLSPDK